MRRPEVQPAYYCPHPSEVDPQRVVRGVADRSMSRQEFLKVLNRPVEASRDLIRHQSSSAAGSQSRAPRCRSDQGRPNRHSEVESKFDLSVLGLSCWSGLSQEFHSAACLRAYRLMSGHRPDWCPLSE